LHSAAIVFENINEGTRGKEIKGRERELFGEKQKVNDIQQGPQSTKQVEQVSPFVALQNKSPQTSIFILIK
jgi:hypothetical protein